MADGYTNEDSIFGAGVPTTPNTAFDNLWNNSQYIACKTTVGLIPCPSKQQMLKGEKRSLPTQDQLIENKNREPKNSVWF